MIHPQHIDLLWVRMAEIYGHKWTSSFGDSDESGTWMKGLKDRTPADIARGIAGCLQREDSWPPSLPEFRDLCKKPVTPFTDVHKCLPKPKPEPGMVDKYLSEMRERVNG